MKIFITRDIPEIGIKFLKEKKFNVEVYQKNKPIPRKELLKRVKNADAVISLLTDKFDKKIIDHLINCKVIANFAVGYNNIDVEYAKSRGIIVTNTPDVLTDSTADLAAALMLAASRRLGEAEKMIKAEKFKGWEPKLLLGVELKNKTVGIIGTGRIGAAFAERITAFGTEIIYFNKSKNSFMDNELNARKVSLNYLLKNSDFVSIHLPLTEKTFHILNKTNLKFLKKTSVIINTSRGEIIDEKELIKLLKAKKIFAAGLDVFENEPKVNPELLNLDNVVLLPHIGSATHEARNAMSLLAAKNVYAVLSGKKPYTPL